jgi:hypothetical protein
MLRKNIMKAFETILFIGALSVASVVIFTKIISKDKNNFNSNNSEKTMEEVNIEILSLEMVIEWFSKNKDLLKDNKDFIATLISEEKAKSLNIKKEFKNKKVFVQAIFNKADDSIVKHRIIICSDLDDSLIKMFENKDMLVFE